MQSIKTISSRGMLQRISTMFGVGNSNWHSDAIDWIGDAIQFIGYHAGFETKPIILEINNFRCNIPNCLESLNYIMYNGHRLPLGIDKSDYGFVNRVGPLADRLPLATYENALMLNKEIDRLAVLQQQLDADPTNPNLIDAIIDCNFLITTYVKDLRLGQYAQYSREWYNIEGDYIKTSFVKGNIQLNANAFIVDEFGYPRVIDAAKYKEAVSWFVISRLILQGYKHPELSWKDANEEWEMWRVRASNEQKMPDIDQLERFTNRWLSVKREAHIEKELDFIQ